MSDTSAMPLIVPSEATDGTVKRSDGCREKTSLLETLHTMYAACILVNLDQIGLKKKQQSPLAVPLLPLVPPSERKQCNPQGKCSKSLQVGAAAMQRQPCNNCQMPALLCLHGKGVPHLRQLVSHTFRWRPCRTRSPANSAMGCPVAGSMGTHCSRRTHYTLQGIWYGVG